MIKIFGSNGVNYEIKDGNNVNSPIIINGDNFENLNDYYQSRTNAIEINVNNNYENKELFIYLEIVNIQNSFSIIENSSFENNRHGLYIYLFKLPIILKNLNSTYNRENGIYMRNSYSFTNYRDIQVNNNKNGIEIYGCCSEYIIENSKFLSNSEESIFIHFQRTSDDKGVIQAFIYNNEFNGQIDKSTIKILKEIDIRIERNSFKLVPSVLHFDGNEYALVSKIYVLNNHFIPNSDENHAILVSKSRNIRIIENLMYDCQGGFLRYLVDKTGELGLTVRNNEIRNCSTSDSFLTIEDQTSFSQIYGYTFENNKFINNYPKSEMYNSFPEFVISTIKIISNAFFSIHKNIFDNPKMLYEFTSNTPQSSVVAHDLTKNYWGSQNIYEKIIGDHLLYEFAKVKINPKYADADFKVEKNEKYFGYVENNILGGDIIGDFVLKAGNYEMKTITRIKRNSKIIVEKGVKIRAFPRTGLEVYGTLEFRGASHDSIIIDTFFKRPDQDKIFTKTSETFFRVNSTYYKVCLRPVVKYGFQKPTKEEYYMFDAVCQSGGFFNHKTYRTYSVWKTDETKLGALINCTKPEYGFCKYEVLECQLFVALTCYRKTWGGIGYFNSAKKSEIKGLSIYNAGLLGFSLSFEFFQHQLKDIYINPKGLHSLEIHQSWVDKNITIENINITSDEKEESYFFIGARNVQLRNSNFLNSGVKISSEQFTRSIKFVDRRDIIALKNGTCLPGVHSFNVEDGQTLSVQIILNDRIKDPKKLCPINLSSSDQKYLKILIYGLSGLTQTNFPTVSSEFQVKMKKIKEKTFLYLVKGNRVSIKIKNYDYFSTIYNIAAESISKDGK